MAKPKPIRRRDDGSWLVDGMTPVDEFEQLVGDIIEKTLQPCRQVLKDSGLKVEEINEVLLVGGSTRIPFVQSKVKDLFKKEPNRNVNPDEVVAVGAAVQGGVLAGDVKDVLLLDVTPLTLAIETAGVIQDRSQEHLGSTDIVIIEVRKALLWAIKQMQDGNEAPGLRHDPKENQFPDFICTADYIPDGEDGPAYCRRVLGVEPGGSPTKVAAE